MHGAILRSLRGLSLGISVALVALLIMEAAGRAALSAFRSQAERGEVLEFQELLSQGGMSRADWAQGYSREFVSIETMWQPYVYWRVEPRQGQYINVDKNGVRRTWNATPAQHNRQFKIFMIGGSAMWGVGARDEFTIPSFISKKLANATSNGVWVSNLAQIGWVSTQGVAALLVELHRGHIPDVVVYDDGANDMYSAYQNGIAGLTINEASRVREFRLASDRDLTQVVLRRLALFKLVERATRIGRRPRAERYPGDDPATIEPLAKAVVDVYLTNVEVVESLATRFGFKAFFFFQPTLFTKKNLSDDEKREMARSRNTRALAYVSLVHAALNERLKTGRYPNVHNLADLFGNDGRTMFLDAVHPLEVGNDRVGTVMVDVARRAGVLTNR